MIFGFFSATKSALAWAEPAEIDHCTTTSVLAGSDNVIGNFIVLTVPPLPSTIVTSPTFSDGGSSAVAAPPYAIVVRASAAAGTRAATRRIEGRLMVLRLGPPDSAHTIGA